VGTGGSTLYDVDAISIVIAVASFAFLLALIEGLDRV
jgi:hypothetical protein